MEPSEVEVQRMTQWFMDNYSDSKTSEEIVRGFLSALAQQAQPLCKSIWRGFECELVNGHLGRHYHDDMELNGDLWWSDDDVLGLLDDAQQTHRCDNPDECATCNPYSQQAQKHCDYEVLAGDGSWWCCLPKGHWGEHRDARYFTQQAQPDHHLRRNPHNNQDWCESCNSYSCQAQQVQPLTDEDASRIALAVFDADGPDSLAIVHDIVLRYEAHTRRRDRMAQQAQPEMPTREQILQALAKANAFDWGQAADAVLALFAPKETLSVCDFCGGDPMTDDDWHKHMETVHNAPPRH